MDNIENMNNVKGQNLLYVFLIVLAVYFLFFYRSCQMENFGLADIANQIANALPKRDLSASREGFSIDNMKQTFKDNMNYLLG